MQWRDDTTLPSRSLRSLHYRGSWHAGDGCSSSVIRSTPTATQVCMKRLILASLLLPISILCLHGQSSTLHTDQSGYTTGTDGNRTVNTYTDRLAIRQAGSAAIPEHLQRRPRRGDRHNRQQAHNHIRRRLWEYHGERHGYHRQNRINLYTDPSGTTTGTIGRRV
jgi:hypothetical protein